MRRCHAAGGPRHQRFEDRKKLLLNALHKTEPYKKAKADVEKAAADVEAARRGGGATRQRMDASSRLNKLKAAVAKLEKQVEKDSTLEVADLERVTATKRAASFRAGAIKAFDWRRELVDAMYASATLRGPVQDGETIGMLRDVTVVEALDHGSVLVKFNLMEEVAQTDKGEGISSIKLEGFKVNVLVTKADIKAARPGEQLKLNQTFRVTKTVRVRDQDVIVVERYPTDIEYLLDLVGQPPNVDEMIEAAKLANPEPRQR